jgi:hypothetical protein
LLVPIGAALIATLVAGNFLTAPAPETIGELPNDLSGRSVQFSSSSGSTLHGWFIPGKHGGGAVVLMHGVRSNRLKNLNACTKLQASQKSFGLSKVQNMSTCIAQHLLNMRRACWNSFKRI